MQEVLMRGWPAYFVALMLIGGCSCDPAGPGLPPEKPPISGMIVKDADQLTIMVDDVLERIVPSLLEGIRRQELGASLLALRSSLIDGHVVRVTYALGQAQSATTRYAAQHESATSEAELDALRLALDIVSLQLADTGR